jgi:hypothetical protein
MEKFLLVIAIGAGLVFAFIDTRPNWDDTGITVGAIVLSCGVLGAVAPQRPWLWALAIGIWIPIFNIALAGNFGALAALVVAFAAAYAGMAFRKLSVG